MKRKRKPKRAEGGHTGMEGGNPFSESDNDEVHLGSFDIGDATSDEEETRKAPVTQASQRPSVMQLEDLFEKNRRTKRQWLRGRGWLEPRAEKQGVC